MWLVVVMRGTRFYQEHHKNDDGKLQDSLHDVKLNVSKSSLIGPSAQTADNSSNTLPGLFFCFEAMLLT
jgi:hypothetical protein